MSHEGSATWNRPKAKGAWSTCVRVGLAVLASACLRPAAADEFLAMPGLWKLSYRASGQGQPNAQRQAREQAWLAQPLWRCVDEDTDPWRAYADLPQQPACERLSVQRTSTSLRWQLQCNNADWLSVKGRLVFDSATHFTGQISRVMRQDNQLLTEALEVSGQRVAACTSHLD